VLLAFGLAIALKAKEASLWEDLGTLNPTLAPFDNVPDFINWFLFVVSSPVLPLGGFTMYLRIGCFFVRIAAGAYDHHRRQRDHLHLRLLYPPTLLPSSSSSY